VTSIVATAVGGLVTSQSAIVTLTASVSPTSPVWVATLKDFVVMAASGVGAVVAILGLNAWKRQLKGQTEYDLSKRILRLCYLYRDAVTDVRNPMMMGHEMPSPPDDEAQGMSESQKRYYGTQKAYEARWEKVRSARVDLYPELLEAEVLWDQQVRERLAPVFKLERTLLKAVQDELALQDPDVPDMRKKHLLTDQAYDFRDKTLYATLDDNDSFMQEFQKGLDSVGEFLKQHLRK